MAQRWHNLLFAHWRCDPGELRRLIPAQLEIDTCDGAAWVGVIPFRMSGVRIRGVPPIPTAHAFAELNVRTYVTLDGRPGVWFFSLDCESSLAVIGARLGVALPYFRASMEVGKVDEYIHFHSRRWPAAGPPAIFTGRYQALDPAAQSAPGSLEHFLTERYCLYASRGRALWRCDNHHAPWQLQTAVADIKTNSMIEGAGVTQTSGEPLLHFAAFQDVRFWLPHRVR